ncbi:hypothetical protein WG954_13675 [Lacibacter sp. H375]|uniref:hypothetical protein n=1 Tax=Lacibacter sp. H375 TaxID=3133424 RepID=UPI0030C329B0
MKKNSFILALSVLLFSCSKEKSPEPQQVDNGPIGGTYTFSGYVSSTYDTIPGSGILTSTNYNTACSNFKGTITLTSNQFSSKGLMFDFVTTGVRKETNTTTGATNSTITTPITGTSGAATTSYSSTYTISTSAGTLNIPTADNLFSPVFIMLPFNKTYNYVVTGNTLKIKSEYYSALNKSRQVVEASFTKQ